MVVFQRANAMRHAMRLVLELEGYLPLKSCPIYRSTLADFRRGAPGLIKPRLQQSGISFRSDR